MAELESKYQSLYDSFTFKLKEINLKHIRYLSDDIDWNNKLIGISGARGVGKTTLVLQHIKHTFKSTEKVLYVSADDMWFQTNAIQDLIRYHYTQGGTHLFIDEIHKLPHWQTIIKNAYDTYPMHIVYTGSSLLKIQKNEGDLSRRAVKYKLHGLSFREYLKFEGYDVPEALNLEQVMKDNMDLSYSLSMNKKILPLFAKYLHSGYYPYYKEGETVYRQKVKDAINEVLDVDLPAVEDISYATIRKTKKMLMILAQCVPFTPKMSEVYRELDTTRDQGLKMLDALERAALLSIMSSEVRSLRSLGKPEKIYLENPNLMYALTQNMNIGTLRETFFQNQLSAKHEVTLPKQGDFLVDEHYTFEVGGRDKDFTQIKDVANSYLAIDDTEYGLHNRIPLWMFGFLY